MDNEEVVQVKVEDEIGIFVKEEEEFVEGPNYNNDYDENASNFEDPNYNAAYVENASNSEDLLVEARSELLTEKDLLVYTTKVDDIWGKNVKSLKNILHKIEDESKPVFTGRFKKKKKRRYMVKFIRFVQNLQHYNDTIARRNKNDEDNNTTEVVRKRQRIIQTITVDDDSDTESVASLTSTDTDDAKNVNTVNNSLGPKRQTNSPYGMVIIRTLRCLSDVYLVSKEGMPKEYYKIELERLDSYSYPSINNISISSCCWYKREEKIKQILPDFSTIFQAFIRRSHKCVPRQCTCCCRRKFYGKTRYMENKPLDMKEVEHTRHHFQNRWQQSLLQQLEQQYENNIINAALASTPKRKINKEQCKKSCYLGTHLNLKIGGTQKSSYYIDKYGSINIMLQTSINPEFPDKSVPTNYLKNMIPENSKEVNEDICCLDKYKKFLLKFVKLGESNIANFFTNSAKLSLNKCDSCDNIKFLTPNTAKTYAISLPKYPKHSKNYIIKKNRPRNITVNENITQINKTKNSVIEISDTTTTGIIHSNTTKIPKIDSQCAVYNNNIKTEKVSGNLIDLDVADLRLIIVPDGSAEIQTKSIPDSISTDNLKILREIIRYANSKIMSLNLNIAKTISVRNLFKKKSLALINIKTAAKVATQQTQTKQYLKTKESPANSTKILKDDVKNKFNKMSLQPITSTMKSLISIEPEVNIERRENNVYQSFKLINAQKRKQYLISQELFSDAGTDLWTNVRMVECQKGNSISGNNVTKINRLKENFKKRTAEKGTSPPPKQKRIADYKDNVTPSNNIVSVPSTSLILRNALMTPSTKQPDQIVESLVSNATVTTLPNNVTVIPIGQLPQDLVKSLYKQYAVLEPSQHDAEQVSTLVPINISEHDIISLDNASLLPTPAQSSNIIPVVLSAASDTLNDENDEIDEDLDKDDDCILGV